MKTPLLAALALAAPLMFLDAGLAYGKGSDGPRGGGSSGGKYEKYFKKGEAAEDRKKYADAVEYYRQALKAKPKDPDALNNLGFALRSVGKEYMMQAAKAYNDALKADPNHEEALEYQGELFLWMGDLEAANNNLQHLKRLQSEEAEELEEEIEAILSDAKKLL